MLKFNLYNLSTFCIAIIIILVFLNNNEKARTSVSSTFDPVNIKPPRFIEDQVHQVKLENKWVKDKVAFSYSIQENEEGEIIEGKNVYPLYTHTATCSLQNKGSDTLHYLAFSCNGDLGNIQSKSYLTKLALCSFSNPIKEKILPYKTRIFKFNFSKKIEAKNSEGLEYRFIALPHNLLVNQQNLAMISDLIQELRKEKVYLPLKGTQNLQGMNQ